MVPLWVEYVSQTFPYKQEYWVETALTTLGLHNVAMKYRGYAVASFPYSNQETEFKERLFHIAYGGGNKHSRASQVHQYIP